MNAQTWALVGVVVGATLGGAAQIVADAVRYRRERRRWIDDHRRTAYVDGLRALEEMRWTLFRDHYNRRATGKAKAEHGRARMDYRALKHPLNFYGSAEVQRLVTTVEGAMHKLRVADRKEDDDPGFDSAYMSVGDSIDDLVAAMRRELGIIR